MENDLASQTEDMLQRVLCDKLNESDRNLLQSWLMSKLTLERCGWKKKLQDALRMVDDERRSSVDANAFIARLYVDMVKILPPFLRVKSGRNVLEPSEEFVNMRSYRLKEVQCMWKTISRMFQSKITTDHMTVGVEASISDVIEKSPADKCRAISSLTFPRGAAEARNHAELNFHHAEVKRPTSLEISPISKHPDDIIQYNRSPACKFSLSHPNGDQTCNATKSLSEKSIATCVARLPRVDAAFTARGTRRLSGPEELFHNRELNSVADSDKGQLSDSDNLRNVCLTNKEMQTNIQESSDPDRSTNVSQTPEMQASIQTNKQESLDNPEEAGNTASSKDIGNKFISNPDDSNHQTPTQKSSNNAVAENQKTLRIKRNRFRKSVKNIST